MEKRSVNVAGKPPRWLGVAHSRDRLNSEPPTSRYLHYFYTFAAEPPFSLQAVSPAFHLPRLDVTPAQQEDDSYSTTQFCTGLELIDGEQALRLDYGLADCVALSVALPVRFFSKIARSPHLWKRSSAVELEYLKTPR